jgi:glycosyltransferase involved in cell wall biosynthesis
VNRKQILFITRWYPDRSDPMLGLFVQRHAEAVQINHDVTVLYVTASGSCKGGIEIEEKQHQGIKEIRVYFKKSQYAFINAIRYCQSYYEGIRKTGVPDLVHVNILTRAALPALWLKFTRGIPYLITEHWSRYLPVNLSKGSYRGLFRKIFTRLAVKNASHVTTVTENLASAMRNLGLENEYTVIPNVADIQLFYPERHTQSSDKKRLVHISCFDEPAKNIKGIIRVAADIARERNDFTLEIIGDGIDYNDVYSFAVSTGLEGTVIRFSGLLEGEKLARRLRQADALVMFSNYENLPCTIVESVCCGVPVISTDVGGIREHVNDRVGVLVESGNERQLKSAIVGILNDSTRFSPEEISNYGLENFSMMAVSHQFDLIYKKIIP